jgi:hypothetical protein
METPPFRMSLEPLAKVSEKDFEKSFPEELESIAYRFLNLSSFRSLLDDGFLSTGHIGLPYATFFWQLKGLNLRA